MCLEQIQDSASETQLNIGAANICGFVEMMSQIRITVLYSVLILKTSLHSFKHGERIYMEKTQRSDPFVHEFPCFCLCF